MRSAAEKRRLKGLVRLLALLSILPVLAAADTPPTSAQAEPPIVYVCPPCGCASDSKTFHKYGDCPDCGMGLVRKGAQRRPYNVALVVFEGVELLDFAGPGEVFSAAMGPNGVAFEVWTVASSTQPVEANRAVLTVVPERSIADCPTPDLVVIPGGAGALTRDRPMMDWIKARAADSEVILSVCNGAMVLAQAGLLDRLEATTHVGMIDVLRRQAPKVRVVAGRRFVDNGKIVTSAGVSAGIDAALHLVGRLLGPEAALNTAKYMEYAWRPEQAATSSPSVPDR